MGSSNKSVADFTVVDNRHLSPVYSLIILEPKSVSSLKYVHAGQFVEVQTPGNATLLRRPISICRIDESGNLWLLVKDAGEGTHAINGVKCGDILNIVFPLGNGFNLSDECLNPLLVGGGVGVAPLLYLGEKFKGKGLEPVFLLGARQACDLLLIEQFEQIGTVAISTEDGSMGEKGLVTEHSILNESYDKIYCCGPLPMMKAIAKIAATKGIDCEVSLENMMGCGVGACLCCVEKTVKGNLCVCSDGPVFNTKELLW